MLISVADINDSTREKKKKDRCVVFTDSGSCNKVCWAGGFL